MAIGKFIRGKKISVAIAELEQIAKAKKVLPMRGEIPHRKGPGIMSGRFPRNASIAFIKLLKSLAANAEHVKMDNPVIGSSVANLGYRPFGRFGQHRKKRTHIVIKAIEATKKGGKK